MKSISRTAAASLVAVLALSGCGGSSSSKGSSSQAPDPAASSFGAGAAQDLVKKSCTADKAGVWRFTGTLKNSSDQKSTYTFSVDIVKTAGSTVVASKNVTKVVPAGKAVTLDFPKVVTTKGSAGMACVIATRAKRG